MKRTFKHLIYATMIYYGGMFQQILLSDKHFIIGCVVGFIMFETGFSLITKGE